MKKMKLEIDHLSSGLHIDLLIERDAGNDVLILFGSPEYATDSWSDLRLLCDKAIAALQRELEP